jgi:glycosyltransferase involved in cell wall biosynthesis
VADQAARALEGPRRLNGERQTSVRPYISIVIATRNAATTLEACLASVFAQTYEDWELIVIDGASTDGTTKILERHGDGIARWVSEPDTGITNAWNKALHLVRGTWVQFLGADDRLASPAVLATLSDALRAAEGHHDVVYATVELIDIDGRVLTTFDVPWVVAQRQIRVGMSIPHPGTFHHRSLFERHGPFDESFLIAADYEFLLRELLHTDAVFVPGVIAVEMGSRGVSSRPENLIVSAIESERARRLHGLARGPAAWAPHIVVLRAKIAIGRVFGPKGVAVATRIYRTVLHR